MYTLEQRYPLRNHPSTDLARYIKGIAVHLARLPGAKKVPSTTQLKTIQCVAWDFRKVPNHHFTITVKCPGHNQQFPCGDSVLLLTKSMHLWAVEQALDCLLQMYWDQVTSLHREENSSSNLISFNP